jgi:glutamate dehydrogenase/leucine dehydrogenase
MRTQKGAFQYPDEIGPEKVLHVYDPKTKMEGILVVDNVARGPAIGGIRMLPDITTEEIFRLARVMTFKNAAADIRHGGGKGGIIADPTVKNKYELIRAYARAIAPITDYIPGPDMGTDERCMAIVYDEIGRAVSLPRELGGIPVDEIGATGYGVAFSTKVACEYVQLDLSEATVAVEGFGAVGRATVKFLAEKGAKIVGVSDSKGATYNPDGLDYDKLLRVKRATRTVRNYRDGRAMENVDLFRLPVDIIIPGARPDAISEENVHDIRAKLVVEAANIPATPEAERILHDRGVLVVPDFIANAGGVITCAVEYRGGTEREAFEAIKEKITKNTKVVLDMVRDQKMLPRAAAEKIAKERVLKSMEYRGRI